jgi:hypothetical protein
MPQACGTYLEEANDASSGYRQRALHVLCSRFTLQKPELIDVNVG